MYVDDVDRESSLNAIDAWGANAALITKALLKCLPNRNQPLTKKRRNSPPRIKIVRVHLHD